MAIPISELQSINPSSIIELFTLQLFQNIHGSNEILRFHSGTNMNSNANIIWQGNSYQRLPVEATGFEESGEGQHPRPVFRIANLLGFSALGQVVTVSDLLILINATTAQNDLLDAKFTRIKTTAANLDASNFPGNTNPFGTPSSDEFPQRIFFIDRKITETKQYVEFEMVSKIDLHNKKIPGRLVTRNDFPGVGTFVN